MAKLMLAVIYVTISSFLASFRTGVEGVSITSIRVPPAVENGSAPVVLDCEYTLAAHERQGLVVQWFFRDHPVPVYQWIPGKRPQDNGPLKGRLNLEHRASEDPYHRHRALEIVKPSTDLGGDYRCKVATFDNEDSQSAHMVVYVPAASFTAGKTKPTVSTVNVTCKVEGIFPEPHLELIQEDGPHGSRMAVKEATLFVSSRDGRYDATLYRVIEDRHLPADTAFECLLSLPATEYQTAQKVSYQPGSSAAGAMPPPDNDIDEDRLHTWMGSGGGTSIPSVSAPHRSQDSVASPTGEQIQTLQDDSESTDMWQSGTGRGIRAHETIADNGANLFSRPRIPGLLLVAVIVAKWLG